MKPKHTYQIELCDEQLLHIITTELRECYIATMTTWKYEKESEQLGDALLTVLEHYTSPSEYEAWYETIKELRCQ